MKSRIKAVLNSHYHSHLAKEEYRNRLNSFLFKLWKVLFKIFCILPVEQKSVLFVASNDFTVPEEYKSLADYGKSRGYNIRFIFKSPNTSDVIYKNELKKILNDIRFQYYYARSRATFVCDYYLPCFANKPRKGTRLVQIWHGCGAFKKWGYSTRSGSWGLKDEFFEKYNVHKTYSLITTSAEFVNDKYAEAFGSSMEKVKALGVPRTDVFFDSSFINAQKELLLQKHPELRGKKIVLWAPTYRGNDLKSSENPIAIDFEELRKALGENFALLCKFHPHLAKKIKADDLGESAQGFVYNISDEFSISSALCFADILISDYSSLIFEYSLLNKPMLFYAYDLDEYNSDRSFYYSYESFVPGPIVKNSSELANAILSAEENFDKEITAAFRNKYMSACDGKSTQRIFDYAVK